MAASEKHRWQFAPRFRRNAFGWRSQPAILRVRQAVAEIGKARPRDPVLAAEGAVLFLERVSPASQKTGFTSSSPVARSTRSKPRSLARLRNDLSSRTRLS